MTAAEILALLVNLLSTAEALAPEIEQVVGVAKKVVSGETVTTSDIQALQVIQQNLDNEVETAASKIEN